MAFRGRGRGRGRGPGGFGGAKQLPFELFPEIEGLGTASDVKEAKKLAVWYSKFEKFYKSSPYFIEDANDVSKKNLGTEIETYSNRDSEKNRPKARLSDFISMDPEYVPAELAKGGDKKGRHSSKRVRWNPRSDTQQLEDLFTKKLQEHKELQEHQLKEAKEEENEDGKSEEEEEEEEDSSNGDYSENEVFDDDEDDFNMPEEENDEPEY